MDYKIIDMPAMKFVGIAEQATMENVSDVCQDIWKKFMPSFNKVGSPSGKGYGVYFGHDGTNFTCMAAQESGEEVPEGMSEHSMGAQKFAVFEHKGKAETIKDTWEAIWKDCKDADKFDHSKTTLEGYPEDWSDKETDTCEIWVPFK